MATEAEASSAEIHYVEITHIESRKNRIVPLYDVFQTTESKSYFRPTHLQDFVRNHHYQVKWFHCSSDGMRCLEEHIHPYRFSPAVIHRLGGTPQAIRNQEGSGSRQRFQRSVSPRQSPKSRASTTREIRREMLNSKKSQKIAVQKRSHEVLKDAMNAIPRKVLKTFTDSHSSEGESSQEEVTPRRKFSNSSEVIYGSSTPRAPTPGRPSVMIRPCSVQLEVMSSSFEISASKGSDTSADLPTGARFTCPSTSSLAERSNLPNGVDSTVFNHLDASADDIVHPSNRHVRDVAHSSLSCRVAEVVQCGVDIRSEVCEIEQHGFGIGGANQHGPVTTAQGEELSPQGRELQQIYARQLELRLLHENEKARAESERIRELQRAQEEAKPLQDLERARAQGGAERLQEVERVRAREKAGRLQELERVRARGEAERLQELERVRAREEAERLQELERARAQEEAQRLQELEQSRARDEAARLRELEQARAQEEARLREQHDRQVDPGAQNGRMENRQGIMVAAPQNRAVVDGYGRPQQVDRLGRAIRQSRSRRQLAVSVYDLYHQEGGLYYVDRLTYRYRVVGTRIHLTQQQTVDILRWRLINKKNPKTFIWTTATIVFTHEELLTSALDPTQVKNVVPGHPRPRIINREKLLLLLSLYHDYVFGEHCVTTVKERESLSS